MTRITRDLEREYPDANTGSGIALAPWRPVPRELAGLVGGFISILFALVGLILLIACTNVGGILLARGVTRSREIGLRLALGARRGRVIQLLVIESILLGATGSVVGIGLALICIRLLHRMVPLLPIALGIDVRLDWRVVVFSVIVSMVAGVLCGLLPALQTSRIDFVATVRSDASNDTRGRTRLRQAFIISQLAMSVPLVIVAMLLGRSLFNTNTTDPGFDVENLEVTMLDLGLAGLDSVRGATLATKLLPQVERLPDVESAALSMVVPLRSEEIGLGPVRLRSQPFDERDSLFPIWNAVTPRYFETLRIPIVSGRSFAVTDRAGAPRVAVVNETLARRLWPGKHAVGETIVHRTGGARGQDVTLEVVGVARDAKYHFLGEDRQPAVYLPFDQRYSGRFGLIARTTGHSALASVRAVVRETDPNLPVAQAGTFTELTAFALVPYRIGAWVAGSVGVLALLLAAIGIYGITAFSVGRRTQEIGIRVALGATPWRVIRQIARQSMTLACTGVLIGLALAALAAQLLVALLVGIEPLDPASFAAGTVLFGALALVATLIPARRAASVNPVEALRAQ